MMASKDSGNLALQHSVPPDGNPFNPDRIQVSDSPRRTEVEAFRLVLHGDTLPMTHLSAMNGQVGVDVTTMLMCSRCSRWKPDKDFTKDTRRTIRRRRSYYCRHCLSVMRELNKL